MPETTEEYRARIDQLESNILTEPYMSEMRPDLAEGIGKTGNRQADIENRQKTIETDFVAVQTDASNTSPSGAEVAVARGGHSTLDERLTKKEQESTAQFAQITSELTAKIEQLVSGVKGTYQTLVLLEAAHANGDDGNYVVTTNGHIYNWGGTKWDDTGIMYQSTGVPTYVDDKLRDLSYLFTKKTLGILENKMVLSDGNATGSPGGDIKTITNYQLSEIFEVPQGTLIKVEGYGGGNTAVLSKWTSNGVYISTVITGTNVPITVYRTSEDIEYLRFCTLKTASSENKISIGSIINLSSEVALLKSENNLNLNFKKISAERRKPVINIQFDDGNASRDTTVTQKLESRGFKGGFPLISDNMSTQEIRDVYLGFQSNGHEILNHSKTHLNLSNSGVSLTTVSNEIKLSYQTLNSYGFKMRGWVSVASALHDDYMGVLSDVHDFGYTVYNGAYETTNLLLPQNQYDNDPLKLWRMSIESTTFTNQKLAIDKLCSDGGMLTIYSHVITSDFDALLDYIKVKVDNNLCEVKTPSACFDHFYRANQSDIRRAIS